MKVLLVNGSPNNRGCTYTGLVEMEKILNEKGIDTEIFHIGRGAISGCSGCGQCLKTAHCVLKKDKVNEFLSLIESVDGIVFGTPVHFANMAGGLKSFLDRAFFGKGHLFRGKPAAVIASARRGGTTAALDALLKYPAFAEMPIVSGRYWNMIHGNSPEEVLQDIEGIQNLQVVATHMAWLLQCIDVAKQNDIPFPTVEKKVKTNFIR